MKKGTVLLLLPLMMACAPRGIDGELTAQRAGSPVSAFSEAEDSVPPVPASEDQTRRESIVQLDEPLAHDRDGPFEQIRMEQAALIRPEPSTVLLLNDTRRRYDKDDHLNLHRVLAQDPVTDTFIEVGFWTLYYADPTDELQAYQEYQRRVLSVSEHFGEWNGYFYTADHNGNGIEELIGFQLAGCCFAPEVWEYSDGAFHQVLDVSLLSDNMLAIEIPGPGEFVFYGPNYVTGDYLRFAFEWNSESGMYELTEQDEVTSYPATP